MNSHRPHRISSGAPISVSTIEDGSSIEVDAAQGAHSVALTYAMLESKVAGRAVTMDEVLAENVDAYQLEIDEELRLV